MGMTDYPAVAVHRAAGQDPGLHWHHYCAFGFAFTVMLAHIVVLGWSDVALDDASLTMLSDGLQTGLHVALAVMLTALSSALPNRGLRYLGVAFALLAIAEGGVSLTPVSDLARAWSTWCHAIGTLGYVTLVLLYARRKDRGAPVQSGRDAGNWTVSGTAGVLVIGLSVTAVLPALTQGAAWSSAGVLQTLLATFIGAAPIVALAAVVNRRGECVISIWLIALLAVQALAWSGRYGSGTWGGQLALLSSLVAELALLNAIMVSIVRHVRGQTRTNRQLQELAHTDGLTGLYNRRYLDAEIERACQRARRTGAPLSVLMADIDHFKLFNDTYGHLQGDECLQLVATVFQRRQQRCDDVACRYGGEELAMILPACDLPAARAVAGQLREEIRALAILHERSAKGRVTMSFGIATVRITGEQRGRDLLRLADDALYAAKRAGRDTVCDMTEIGNGTSTGLAPIKTWRIGETIRPLLDAIALPSRTPANASMMNWGAVVLFCGLLLATHPVASIAADNPAAGVDERDDDAPQADVPALAPPADIVAVAASSAEVAAIAPVETPAPTAIAAPAVLDYDALIARARNGDTAPALTYLRAVEATAPDRARLAADHITVASWSGADEEAITVYEGLPDRNALPDYALLAVGRAYRQQERLGDALATYELALLRKPDNQEVQSLRMHTLADLGRLDEVLAANAAAVKARPDDVQARLSYGSALSRAKQPFAALFEFDRARRLAPNDTTVERAYVLALQNAGLSDAAGRLATPATVSAAERRRIEADKAAELVRMAHLASPTDEERFNIAARALAFIDPLIASWRSMSPRPEELSRLRADRLGALQARGRYQAVVDDYRAMLADGLAVPVYAQRWVAAAYLQLRQPAASAEIMRRVTEVGSAEDKDEIEFFFAQVESGAVGEGMARIGAATRAEPIHRRVRGVATPQPNEHWLELAVIDGQAPLSDRNPAEAQVRLEQLVDGAPDNQVLRVALASTYLARDWPRRAEQTLKLAEQQEPRNVELEIEQAHTALELQEWRQADLLVEDVLERYPERTDVQLLARQHQLHHGWEMRVQAERGWGNTNQAGDTDTNPVLGSREHGIDTLIYSPPLMDDWRLFGGYGEAHGHFEEGSARHHYGRAGVSWRVRDITVEAEASAHRFGAAALGALGTGPGEHTKAGARLTGTYDIDDHWQVGLEGEVLSRNTPLRALNAGIRSNAVTASVRWRADDRRSWRLNLSPSHFSDGNDRQSIALLGIERLYTSPRFMVDFGLAAEMTHNSHQDGPYFSPKNDLTVLPSLDFSQTLHENYDVNWRHHVMVGAGTYRQAGYATRAIGVIGYGHRWRNDAMDAGLTFSMTTRPYDGQREHEKRAVFDMIFRF
jgi:biofilm PGA synthesis protein PgaA